MTQIKTVLDELAPKSSEDKTTPKAYNHIDLSEEETTEALRIARQAKHYTIERQKYFDRIRETKVVPMFSPEIAYKSLRNSVNTQGQRFVVDDDNSKVVRLLCLYFSNDKRFEEDGRSLSKGICLMGPVGVGKTYLMNFFRSNPLQSYVMPSCTKIENKWVNDSSKEPYLINDIGIIDHYSSQLKATIDEPFLHLQMGICFEDLGTRENPNQKRYGEEKNVMMEIILNRYAAKIPFNQTHFTTNLDVAGIEHKYGTRVRDRMKEMCNLIILEGKSRRA